MTDLPSNSNPPHPTEATKEIVRVVESDHKATLELISRLATLRAGLRGVIITLASTVLGLAIAQSSWPIAAFGVPVVVAGYFAEARLEFLLRLAHDRAVTLERKVQAYLSALVETGVVRQDADAAFQREVKTYQFGTSRSLRGPSITKTIEKSVRDVMTWVYVAFVIALTVSAAIIGYRQLAAPPKVYCVEAGTGILESREIPTARTGSVSLVPCPPPATAPVLPDSPAPKLN